MARKAKHRTTARRKKSDGGRASWRGMLRFGLVSIPVEAINAHSTESADISFHQLHAECGRRIHYEKVCPVHGAVSNDEIVSGYEYGKGKYVEFEAEELDALRTEKEKALTIDTFIEPTDFDPLYFDGRMYYIVPDGEAAREPYGVFLKALENQERWGVGQVVFSGKEQVALVRAYGQVIHMALLNFDAEMRDAAKVAVELPAVRGADRKVHLAEEIIRSWTVDTFDYDRYVDTYQEKMRQLIDAKIAGREVVTPEPEEEPEVINLMDALKKSMKQVGGHAARHGHGKPAHHRRKSSRTAKSHGRRHAKAG